MLICVLTHKMVYRCSSRGYHRVTNVILKWSGDCLSNWHNHGQIFFWFSPGRSTGRQMLTVSRNCKETPLFQQNLQFTHLVLLQNSYFSTCDQQQHLPPIFDLLWLTTLVCPSWYIGRTSTVLVGNTGLYLVTSQIMNIHFLSRLYFHKKKGKIKVWLIYKKCF